jgi:hypothetical protein
MVTLISRWVNNHQQPDDFYRDLLSRATGRAPAELFSDEPVALAPAAANHSNPRTTRPVDAYERVSQSSTNGW